MTYTGLTENDVNKEADSYLNKYINKSSKQNRPIAVLVAGQPGAGKSAASRTAKKFLSEKGGYIRVDADRMRELIPTHGQVYPSDVTQQDAGRLVKSLRTKIIHEKRNFLEEGTFRDPEGLKNFVEGLKDRGYEVQLLAVSTAKEKSLLGVYKRYEMQIEQGSTHPRILSDEYHNMAYQGFMQSLKKNERLFDQVKVINRAGDVLFDSALKKNKHDNAFETVYQYQKLSLNDVKKINEEWLSIQETAIQRSEKNSSYLESITNNISRVDTLLKEQEASMNKKKDQDISW
jgi:dephospho-CoA kinase